MDAGSLQGDAERFFIDQLPKPDVETPAKPKPAGLGQYEIQTGSSFLMVVLAYGPDNFGCHPLRVHWVCTTQVLCGYGETLIPVAEVREEP